MSDAESATPERPVPAEPDPEEPAGAPSDGGGPLPWYRWPGAQIRRLYNWTLSWAESRYATPALFVLAFAEASFFPIPPDVLLTAMSLGRPKRAWMYAAICTAGSVLGALLGFYIGYALWRSLGVSESCAEFAGGGALFDYVPGFACDKFAIVRDRYQENAFVAVLAAAATPIPYKIFTIAAGVFRVSIPVLIGASIVGRGARFFAESALIYFFGPRIRTFIEKRFELMMVVFTILLVGGFVALKFLH